MAFQLYSNADNAQRAGQMTSAFNEGANRALRQRELDARLKQQQIEEEREKILFPLRKQEMELRSQSMANQLQTTSLTLQGARDEEAQYGQELTPLGEYGKALATASADQLDKLQPPVFRSLKAQKQAKDMYETALDTTAAITFKTRQQEAARIEARAGSEASVSKAAMKVDPGFREFAIVNGVKNPDELDAFAVNELKTRYDKQVNRQEEISTFREKQKLATEGRIEVKKVEGENTSKRIAATAASNAAKIENLNDRAQYNKMMDLAGKALGNFDDAEANRWQQRAEEVFAKSTENSTPTQSSAPNATPGTFQSSSEVEAAFKAGKLKVGDTVVVNGKKFRVGK